MQAINKITHIITDIEGTTSSISFVKEVLFPYSREHLKEFLLGAEGASIDVQRILEEVPGSSLSDKAQLLIRYIDEDKKFTPLKELQGLIWRHGYEQGHYQGHIYEDAYKVLLDWHSAGIKLYVYSSGSVTAQKLLFGYTQHGDLNYLFSGNFDTRIGAKASKSSYENIQHELNAEASSLLFLSDIEAELDAAAAAGLNTVKLVRDLSDGESKHRIAKNFYEADILI